MKQAVHAVLQILKIFKRIPSCEFHDVLLFWPLMGLLMVQMMSGHNARLADVIATIFVAIII